MLQLESKNANYCVFVPTKESEINEEVLKQLLSNFTLPQYYCVVALRYRVKLFDLTITSSLDSIDVIRLIQNNIEYFIHMVGHAFLNAKRKCVQEGISI